MEFILLLSMTMLSCVFFFFNVCDIFVVGNLMFEYYNMEILEVRSPSSLRFAGVLIVKSCIDPFVY